MPAPVDPESWTLPEWMTWDDYRPVPGVNWNDPERQPVKKLRSALILGDFSDRDFIVTMPEGSDIFGLDGVHNPIGVGAIPREEVGDFYADFHMREPQELNHFHTINEYWLEDSYGLIGVDATAFGPYRMTGKEHEYGLGGGDAGGAGDACPTGDTCGQDFDTELIQASLLDVTAGIATNGEDYDFRFLLHAGYDESGVWAEFGPMMFPAAKDVSEALGNPDATKPNSAGTRYVDWTSFAAAEGIWSHAVPGVTSTQGENDGAAVFAHELRTSSACSTTTTIRTRFRCAALTPGPGRCFRAAASTAPAAPTTAGRSRRRWGRPWARITCCATRCASASSSRTRSWCSRRQTLTATGPIFATIYPRAYPAVPGHDRYRPARPPSLAAERQDAVVRSGRAVRLRRRGVSQLHGRSRRPHRLRLVHAGPRRADREEQGRGRPHALRVGDRRAPARTSTRGSRRRPTRVAGSSTTTGRRSRRPPSGSRSRACGCRSRWAIRASWPTRCSMPAPARGSYPSSWTNRMVCTSTCSARRSTTEACAPTASPYARSTAAGRCPAAWD